MIMSEASLEGRFIGKPDGVMNEEVSMKKINNRKMMSVIDDMLKLDSILFLD
ncbi:hypothetical protein P872_16420 [Rhodonellum psychrophilum GCM71 = DSM 17998]|uniref:Uncharacterized protein n=1 Tax=Rhodonellum psychrophilum GCM71 = DSM 17998 TaxID=1123057 RepID=U5C4X7_9BACT|nr:hypothetical protein P872_16420 [Rhodonellum psychrophilum GCM71 = DSM 17998]